MYKKTDISQLSFEDFYKPFNGELDTKNKWIYLSKIIPWDYVEQVYASSFSETEGAPAISSRMAFGSLVVKEYKNLTDRETVEEIRENIYIQYFLGYKEFQKKRPFDPSMLVYFRKRFPLSILQEINKALISGEQSSDLETHLSKLEVKLNAGKLILDATVAPADITYPTDLKLLNKTREKSETIIDKLHNVLVGVEKKVRTYRQKARKDFLSVIKKKRKSHKEVRKAIKHQLGYIKRNLKHIKGLISKVGLSSLSAQLYKDLLVIHEIYSQQLTLYKEKIRSLKGRIVNLFQPHVRAIPRGKSGKPVEFGIKISLSVINGYSFIDKYSWDPYNESKDLIPRIELYKKERGLYPASVHADKIYRTRENIAFCKRHGIRLLGPALGRPKKDIEKDLRRQMREDEIFRSRIEGQFGVAKRRFSMDKIMTKRTWTSETSVGMIIFAMNLEKKLRASFLSLWNLLKKWLWKSYLFSKFMPEIA